MGHDAAQKAEQLVTDRFVAKTKRSREYHQAALTRFPAGVTRNLTYFEPYPIFMERGAGCCLYDYDGNEYLDYVNDYSAILHGHNDPDILAAAHAQLEKGTILTAPSHLQLELAELLCERTPSMELIRFANSGTEATFYALRLARAFTGKQMYMKMVGGFHGSHDAVEVDADPELLAQGILKPRIENPGIPANVVDNVVLAHFNDLESAEAGLRQYEGQVGAIMIEPVLGTAGVIPPIEGYLEGLRELADRHDALLIFDEIVSYRFSVGGYQEIAGVTPDLTALGKIIGGGFAIGAFGGRRRIMEQLDPRLPAEVCVPHSGTFTGANVGIAAMRKYDAPAVERLNGLGGRLRDGLNAIYERRHTLDVLSPLCAP
jgi:glutamate-1-semialdehyde 2,1-aminomutase